jgi:hypothetical protein
MNHPADLTSDEVDEWKEKRLRPIQKRVLFVLGVWLEEHDMLHQEPQVARRAQEFLIQINAPPSLAQHAKAVLRILERLVSPTYPSAHQRHIKIDTNLVRRLLRPILRRPSSLPDDGRNTSCTRMSCQRWTPPA